MGELVEITKNLPAELQGAFNVDDLAGDLYDGVSGGFGVISIRGSKWRVKKGGDETLIEKEIDGEMAPVPTIEVVLVKSSKKVSKIFYPDNFKEGDDSPPSCFSIDGEKPDASAENKQAESCAVCPKNVWGSKITPAGKKTKACADSRRVAVVPLGELSLDEPEPLLLRVPAASLSDLAAYGKGMAAKGFPYNAIATRIGFDPNAAYPKLTFKPIRKLTEDEAAQVSKVFYSDQVANILEVAHEVSAPSAEPAAVPEEPVSLEFEEEAPSAVAETPKKKATKKKATAKKAAPAADAEDDLDGLIAELDNLT